MLTFSKRQGMADAEVLQLMTATDSGGYAKLTDKYDGSEELLCVLWPGDDRSITTTLPASWDDGPLGKVRIEFPADVTTTLEPTWYGGLLSLASDSTLLAEFRVVVEAAPGSAAPPKVYHRYQDLVDELPWVGKLADQLNDQGGFVEVAAAARRWIDAAILRSVPVRGAYGSPWYGFSSWDDSYNGVYGSLGQAEDPDVAAALDADQLDVTTATGRRFVEASIYWTLAKVLKRAVGMQANNDLLKLSDEYKDAADKKLATCVAVIDTNGDGVPEYVLPLNRRRMIRM
jgi:hypothetical protein